MTRKKLSLGARSKKATRKEREDDSELTRARRRRGRSVRARGHAFERELANMLKHVFPDARRHLEYQKEEANGVDLVGTYPYLIQAKRKARYASLNDIRQVDCCRIAGEVPVLVTKADGVETLAALPFDELIRLLEIEKAYNALKNAKAC